MLTSCGNPYARLQINDIYVVGVGGACSPINGWSNLNGFSQDEINLLRQLRTRNELGVLDCGALCIIPSMTFSLLALLVAMMAQSQL